MSDDRTSIRIKGELAFAQKHEAVSLSTPVSELDEAESAAAYEEFIEAAQNFDWVKLRYPDDQRRIDLAERRYDKAVLVWTEVSDLNVERGTSNGEHGTSEAGAPVRIALADALEFADERQLDEAEIAARLEAWSSFCAYVFQGGISNPWQAFKNFLAVVRRASPKYISGVTQTEIGVLLNETKASPSAREKRIVEGLMRRFNMLGFHLLGGTKTETARRKSAQSQQGNTNRRKAKRGAKR